MGEDHIKRFIKRVKLESNIHKFLKEDLIYELIDFFKKDFEKKNTLKL